METFSKSELIWIHDAIGSVNQTLRDIIEHPEGENPITIALVQLRLEGLTIAQEKLNRVIDSGAKRIAVR